MDDVVRAGVIATAFWGVVGLLVGVCHRLAAGLSGAELRPAAWHPELRPAAAAAHQCGDLRLWRQRADHDVLLHRAAHLRGRGCGAATLPGSCSGATVCSSCWPRPSTSWASTEGKEYAETGLVHRHLARPSSGWPIWPSSSARCSSGKEPHIYVANWFYLSFIVTVAMLHVVNNLAIPVSILVLAVGAGLSAACRMRWCSGGMATTPSASS